MWITWWREYFNPQGPRGPRRGAGFLPLRTDSNFNPQGPRGPRLTDLSSIYTSANFNPQGPRGPRLFKDYEYIPLNINFNPQGPRGPRPVSSLGVMNSKEFQSTRPSRASTLMHPLKQPLMKISIHKALAGLDPFRQSPKF